MRVLAIDTALAACSAAVLDTEHGGIVASESLPMSRGHAEALMPLVKRVMERAGVAFSDIDRVAVTTGPGSFTAPRLASLREAVQAAAAAPACIVGSAALAVADALPQTDSPPVAVDAREAPDIAWVARMGAVVPESQSPPAPQYLRAPDAQPQHAAQLPRR